jgi:non-specific serine/threonine protein kinase
VQRLCRAWDEEPAAGLLELAGEEWALAAAVSPALRFWRDFTRDYLVALCHTPGLEADLAAPVHDPPPEHWRSLAERVPPMKGIEYLTPKILLNIWRALDARARKDAADHKGGPAGWLMERHPNWRLVGRVTFHLAENKRDTERPFAFMATYTSGLSDEARPQYIPLNRALQEYAGEKNKNALLRLLAPVQNASERSGFIRTMVEDGTIYRPLAWSAREAYRFLKEIPAFEESGIVVRVPDWWKSGRPPRPQVRVTIDERKGTKLGADALLDFNVAATIEGEPLTEEEWRRIAEASSGLVSLRGRWVEVDADRLAQIMARWKKAEKESGGDGVSFLAAMRLLAGVEGAEGGKPLGAGMAEAGEWFGVHAGPKLATLLRDLKNPEKLASADPGGEFKAELRPYQREGVNWLYFLTQLGLGACLADDMGLGKTIQFIGLLMKLKTEAKGRMKTAGEMAKAPAGQAKAPTERTEAPTGRTEAATGRAEATTEQTEAPVGQAEAPAPSLLIVPASLVANWKAEIERFAPTLLVLYAHPSETPTEEWEPKCGGDGGNAPDLVITTYGMLQRTAWMRKHAWAMVALDEAQAIKNPGTRQTRAVKEVKARRKAVLTGTPVENRLSDLWSIFDFLNPGLLGSVKEFGKFAKECAAKEPDGYGPLRRLVGPYILRRLKTDKNVIADLPEKTEVKAFCPLVPVQAALYQKAVRDLATLLQSVDGIQRRGAVLASIMRFKQICNHPAHALGDGNYEPARSGKFGRLREIVEELAERQEKALVFTQFREIADPLAEFLAQVYGRPGLTMHGGTPVGKRRQLVKEFQKENGPPFFVLSLKVGGMGLNLTEAGHVIHFDRWWNPAVENQATDRAFRIGQKKNVMVHKFVCRGTIEERIDALIGEKIDLARAVVEEGVERRMTEMSNAELLRFVSLDIGASRGD